MKNKIIIAISFLIIVVMCFTALTACKSTEEKELEFYEKTQKEVTEVVQVIDQIKGNLENANFKTSFSYIQKYYNGASRGSTTELGWKETSEDAAGNTVKNAWMVKVINFEIVWQDLNNIYISSQEYAEVTEDDYKKGNTSTLEKNETIAPLASYLLDSGAYYGNNSLAMNIIFDNLETDLITQDALSVESGNKIYTNILRVDLREVYDSQGNIITREDNLAKTDAFNVLSEEEATAENVKYWSGYGEDLLYNWSKVYSMFNNRVTFQYNSKKVLRTFELYQEKVISYYSEKSRVDKTYVLKADVVATVEAVMNFEFPKKGESILVPTL